MNKYHSELEQIAFAKTYPFCYGCYKRALSGICSSCGSDDCMRELPGVGVAYGMDWVIEHLVDEALTPANLEQSFEELIADCYPQTVKVGWIEVDTVSTIKMLDSVSWDIALSEYVDQQAEDEKIVTFNNGTTYYWFCEVEDFIGSNLVEP